MKWRERRESVRVNYLCECQVESEGLSANKVNARINDLSVDGAFIDSMAWLPVGSIIKMKFKVQDREIQVNGEVRYYLRHVGMGVRFFDLTPTDSQIIESAVSRPDLAGQHDRVLDVPSAIPIPPQEVAGGPLPAMAGDLAAVNLFEVIDVIENSRLTGCLTVRRAGLNSKIQFNEGVIVGASDGSGIGVPALNRILSSLGEMFEFYESPSPFLVTIPSSGNTSLILEMLIHNDEEARVKLC